MNVVITGSTRGIGLGMAREFLRRGHRVVISSRGEVAVTTAVAALQSEFGVESVTGLACDVADYRQVRALWEHGSNALGRIDEWINNAGRDGQQLLFDELPPEEYASIVNTNLLGLMHCNHIAIAAMKKQGSGRIWNMEGFGSNGATMAKYGPYGATKFALRYLTKVLIKECKDTPVQMCYLSPGMVITDMLASDEIRRSPDWPRKRRIYNILADTVDTVTPWLVDGILNARGNGAAVRWLTTPKVIWRFMTAGISKRDILTPMGY